MKVQKLNQEQIVEYELLSAQLGRAYIEMKDFSKKIPNVQVNDIKAQVIDRILKKIQTMLSNEPTIEFLDDFDMENLPTISDAVLIIGQYSAALQLYKDKYSNDYGNWL